MLRRLLPIAVLLCGIGIFAFGAGSAGAEALPMSQCTTSSGVVVAVDFGHWHGPIVRGCGSTPTNGYQLINQGGFSTTLVRGEPFVCEIGYSGFNGGTQYPAGANCGYTPPSKAYWSYWNADPGQHGWTFSTKGADDSYPVAGAVQAWEFGDGSQPPFSPDSVRARNSPPASRSAASSAPAAHASSPAVQRSSADPAPAPAAIGTGSASHSTAAHQAGLAHARPTASKSTRYVSVLPRVIGTISPSASIVDAQADAPTQRKSPGSAWPLVGGGVIVVALAALAAFTVLQRRQAR